MGLRFDVSARGLWAAPVLAILGHSRGHSVDAIQQPFSPLARARRSRVRVGRAASAQTPRGRRRSARFARRVINRRGTRPAGCAGIISFVWLNIPQDPHIKHRFFVILRNSTFMTHMTHLTLSDTIRVTRARDTIIKKVTSYASWIGVDDWLKRYTKPLTRRHISFRRKPKTLQILRQSFLRPRLLAKILSERFPGLP